jgi:hypothetical protein
MNELTHVIDREPDGRERGLPGGESDGLPGVVVSVARRVDSGGDSVVVTGVTILVLAAACSAALVYAGVTSKIKPFFGAGTAGP